MKSARKVENHITEWLKSYLEGAQLKGFVVGISGGVDSAVTSTLCAKTGNLCFVWKCLFYKKQVKKIAPKITSTG